MFMSMLDYLALANFLSHMGCLHKIMYILGLPLILLFLGCMNLLLFKYHIVGHIEDGITNNHVLTCVGQRKIHGHERERPKISTCYLEVVM